MKKTINIFSKISRQDVWNAENIYHLKSDISRIGKLLYHYEIYKRYKIYLAISLNVAYSKDQA